MRTIELTRASSSAISVPIPIVSATFAAVKTIVRTQRVPEDRVVEDRAVVGEADADVPWCWISSNSP